MTPPVLPAQGKTGGVGKTGGCVGKTGGGKGMTGGIKDKTGGGVSKTGGGKNKTGGCKTGGVSMPPALGSSLGRCSFRVV